MDIKDYVEKFEKLMPGFMKVFHSNDNNWLEELNITIAQCVVLQNLADNDNCKMSDLSESIGVTMGNITGMIDRIEKEDLVKRVADSEDRRIIRVQLTQKGNEVVKKIFNRKRKNLTSVLSKLSDSDRINLLKIMEKIANSREIKHD